MATNITSTGHSGEDHASISIWESDTEGALGGDIEILEIYNDDDSGVITVSSALTFAGATGTSATAYRCIRPHAGDGWEGDCNATSPVTLDLRVNNGLNFNEEYFLFDGIRLVGNATGRFAFTVGADNVTFARCFCDGRPQTFNVAHFDSNAGIIMTRCLFLETYEYGGDCTSGDGDNYYSNCTWYGCNYGPTSWGSGSLVYNNSISVGNQNNHYADDLSNWATGTDYNIMGGADYYPTGNVLQNATAQDTTTPTTGNRVMYEDLTADSEDFNLIDNADNDALEYGKTLTGRQALDDPNGESPAGTWDCGCFNLASAPVGEINEVTITSSVTVASSAEPQRWRDRINADNFALNDGFILELVSTYVINSILISSDLSINDNTNIQRMRDRVSSSALEVDHGINIQRWRDRIASSEFDLDSFIGTQRERNRLIDAAIDLGSYIGQQLDRNRRIDSSLDLEHDVNIQRMRDRVIEYALSLDFNIEVARQLDRSLTTALDLYDAIVRSIKYDSFQIYEKTLSSSLELEDSIYPTAWYVRKLLSSLVITHNLTYDTAQLLLHAITLHSELEVNDAMHVERKVLRLVESFVPIYEQLLSQANVQRKLTDEFVLYEDILQDVIKVLSDILLHDNLELSDRSVVSIQRLFKPIGIIIYGLNKSGIQYGLKQSGKIEYTLQGQKKIIYTLENIKGDTVYH